MLVAPEDLSVATVASLVRAHWDGEVDAAVHLPVGAGAWHWAADAGGQRRWFVTADAVDERPAERLARAYAAARDLAAAGLEFVLAGQPTTSGALVVPVGRYVLSVVRWTSGRAGPFGPHEPAALQQVRERLARLHAAAPPPGCPVWRPGPPRRAELEHALTRLDEPWEDGPYGPPTRDLLRQHGTAVRRQLSRFDQLAARAGHVRASWVVTHGEPHAANVIHTSVGPVLCDWESVVIAPAERDLRDVGRAGRPEFLELFDLEWSLWEVGDYAWRFGRPHPGSADDERFFGGFVEELQQLAAGAS